MNDFHLDLIAKDIADDINAEVSEYGGEPSDLAHEAVDGSEHVIYYSKAHDICQNCNTDEGEAFLEDVGAGSDVSYNSLAVTIAYGELYSRVCAALEAA